MTDKPKGRLLNESLTSEIIKRGLTSANMSKALDRPTPTEPSDNSGSAAPAPAASTDKAK